jgi:glucose-1-phosphate thymidylyltransferase
MKALILAAGYATRLYPITRKYPKSLLEVNGQPIINHIIDSLRPEKDIDEIIVITNSKFLNFFKKWKSGFCTKIKLTLIDDETEDNETRLGAIGDMDFAIEKNRIKDDLLVIGGDNLFGKEVVDFLKFAKEKRNPSIGVYDIKDLSSATHYGVVNLDRFKRIINFQEKPKRPRSSLVAMCLYYFPRENLSLIKGYLGNRSKSSDATGLYIDWLRKKLPVYGFVFKSFWFDIGSHQSYNHAKDRLLV